MFKFIWLTSGEQVQCMNVTNINALDVEFISGSMQMCISTNNKYSLLITGSDKEAFTLLVETMRMFLQSPEMHFLEANLHRTMSMKQID